MLTDVATRTPARQRETQRPAIPELSPPTIVTADLGEITDATQSWGAAMLKPTDGMAGRGILLLRPDDPNLRSLLEVTTTRGRDQVVVQRFVPESVHRDRRVVVLDGSPIGVVRRIARPGEFRCNMAAGATTVGDLVTARDKEICAKNHPDARHVRARARRDRCHRRLPRRDQGNQPDRTTRSRRTRTRTAENVIAWVEQAQGHGSTRPARIANLVSSSRSRMPSLCRMFARCRSTVLALMTNVLAISFDECPSAISLTISSSRG